MQKNSITINELSQFLEEASKYGYANKEAKKTPSSRLNSEDYHFEKGDLIYHDTYFGVRDFIGEEIVYKNKIPVWGGNYFGFILSPEIEESELYDFLRRALLQDYNDIIPVRGPKYFSYGDWTYRFAAHGDLTNFIGQEEIFSKDSVVYRALVHGGLIR